MRLTLDPLDLLEQFQEVSHIDGSVIQKPTTSKVKYMMFKPDVRIAIDTVGEATFYAWGRSSYHVIYPQQ